MISYLCMQCGVGGWKIFANQSRFVTIKGNYVRFFLLTHGTDMLQHSNIFQVKILLMQKQQQELVYVR